MKQIPASWPAWRSPIAPGRQLLWLLVMVLLYATSCTEGPAGGPVDPGNRSVRVGLVPRYHYSGMDFNAPNRIRWSVLRAGTQDTLQTGIQPVDPNDSTWTLQVEFNLPAGVSSANVVVLLELLAGDVVEWSGKTAPIAVTPAGTSQQSAPINMYQGPPANLEINGVDITIAPATLTEGDTATLIAIMSPVGQGTLFWGSIDTAVATVSSTGVVRTKRDGSARIRAIAGPKEDTVVIAVRQRVASIRVSPDSARSNSLGDTLVFTATVLDPRNAPISGAAVTWSSAQPGIAEAAGNGRFVARSLGTATVTATSATSGSISGAARAISAQRASVVGIEPAAPTLGSIGEQLRLTATAVDARGSNIANATFTWRSNAPSIVSVDGTGLVTALANGDAQIVATSADGLSGSVVVSVRRTPASVSVDPASLQFTAIGDTARVRARVLDGAGTEIPDQPVTWSASGAVSVDATGLVRANAAGSGVVTASSGSLQGSASATVQQAVARLEIQPLAGTIRSFGGTLAFSAHGFDRNNNPIAVQPLWSSSNTGTATIDEASGIATGRANGSTTITARAGSAQASTTLTVSQLATALLISPDSLLLEVAGSGTFTAALKDAAGSAVTGATITWTSLEPALATVDQDGKVAALRSGVARIVASNGTVADTARAIIGRVVVEVTPDSLVFTSSFEKQPFSAVVRDAAGRTNTAARVTWSSLQPSVAVVDSSGVVMALNAGRARIVATVAGAADTAVAVVAPRVASIAITPAVDTVLVGQNVAFSAQVLDAHGSQSPTETVLWTSSDTTIATVDQQGAVTGKLGGAVTITASAGGVSADATLIVRGTPDLTLLELSVSPPDSVSVGDTIRLNVIVKNVGTDVAPATMLHLRLANGATGSSIGDTLVAVRSLAPGEVDAATKRVFLNPAYSWPPTARLQATVDPANAIAEVSESNNAGQTPTVSIRTHAAPPPTGLPAEVVIAAGDTAQLTSSVPNAIYSLMTYSYGTSVSPTGRVYGYATGAFPVLARDSAHTVADTILVWVVPRGYTRAWVPAGVNARFDNATNWQPNGVPGAADVLFIPDCYTYLIAACTTPVLQANTAVTAVLTGYYDGGAYSVAQRARPARSSFVREERTARKPGAGLEGESLQRYLQRRASHDSAYSARTGRSANLRATSPRLSRTPREAPPAANAEASPVAAASMSSYYEFTIDLNGYTLAFTGNLPQYASFGSADTTRVGTVQLTGSGQLLSDVAIYGDLLVTGTNANVGDDYSSWVERDLTISGSATVKADVGRNLEVTGTLNVPNWIEINGGATFTNAQVIVDDGDLYVYRDVTINGGTFNLDPTGYGGYADFYSHVTISNATVNIGDGGFWVDSSMVVTNSSMPLTSGYLQVEGNTSATNTNIPVTGGWIEINGNLTMDGGTIGGTGDVWPSFYFGDEVWSDSLSAWVYQGTLTLKNGAVFSLANGWGEVYGDFIVQSGATFSMVLDPDFEVYGDAVIDGGSTAGKLLGGELYFYGDLTVGNSSSATAYSPAPAHWTEFGYTSSPRTHDVTMANASASGNHFGSVYSYSAGDSIRFHQPVFISGSLQTYSDLFADSIHVHGGVWNGGRVFARRAVLDSSFVSSYYAETDEWQVGQTMLTGGASQSVSATVNGDLAILGTPDVSSLSVYGNVMVAGSGARWTTGYGSQFVSGNLLVRDGAELLVSLNDLQVDGTLRTETGGYVAMTTAYRKLLVGNAEFLGGPNVLEDGSVQLRGNLVAGNGLLGATGAAEIHLIGTDTTAQQLQLGGGTVPALRLLGTSPVQLMGDVVTGLLESNATATVGGDVVHHIIATNANITQLNLQNTWLGIGAVDAHSIQLANLRFRFATGLSVPQQLRLTLPAGTTLENSGFDFDSLMGGSLVTLNPLGTDPTDVSFRMLGATKGGNSALPPASRFAGHGTIFWNGTRSYPGPVSGVTVSPTVLNLTPWQVSSPVVATVTGGAGMGVTWTSDDPAIASVDSTGRITAGATPGFSTAVRARSVEDPTKVGVVTVTVIAPPPPPPDLP